MDGLFPEPYAGLAARIFASVGDRNLVTQASDVAEVVWRAANDTTDEQRFLAGADALATARARRAG
jgi:hypothetical protein